MIFLVFETKQLAQQAEMQISANMKLEPPELWSLIRPRRDNKWAIVKPDNLYMTSVHNYIEEEYDAIMYNVLIEEYDAI